jgi:hypothetical protein
MGVRCDYCNRPATKRFRWRSWFVKLGQRRGITLQCAACDEHVGCTNWEGMKALHPDAPVEEVQS